MSDTGWPFEKKKKLPFAQYVAAALIDASRHLASGITSQPEELPAVLQKHFNVIVDAQEISDAIEILQECGVAYVAKDALAGTFVRITDEKFARFLSDVDADQDIYIKAMRGAGHDGNALARADDISTPSWDLIKKYNVLQKYSEFGFPFIENAMRRVGTTDLSERLFIGGDRLVSFSDNQPVVEEIRQGLDDLEVQLRTNNEVGIALGDARDEAVAELKTLQSAMAGNHIRAAYLLLVSRNVLGWIGRLISKTSAEEVVKHLTKLFIGWLS